MIQGTKLWNSREKTYFSQVNNAIEALVRAIGKDNAADIKKLLREAGIPEGAPAEKAILKIVSRWLESCGSTSFIMALASMGVSVDPPQIGVWKPQPEDLATLYLNSESNADRFRKVRRDMEPGSLPGNRVPQYYPEAAADLYGVQGIFSSGRMAFDSMGAYIKRGSSVMLCLIDPGHYITAVAFDEDRQEIIFNDPWPGRFQDGNGFNRRMSRAEYEGNTKPFAVIFNA